MTSFRSDHQRYTGSVRRRRKIPLLLRRELFPVEAFHKRGISHLGMLTLELPTKKGEKKRGKLCKTKDHLNLPSVCEISEENYKLVIL